MIDNFIAYYGASYIRDFTVYGIQNQGVDEMRPFAGHIFKIIFLQENLCIYIKISSQFVCNGPIDKQLALVQVVVWRWTGAKPLPETLITQFK